MTWERRICAFLERRDRFMRFSCLLDVVVPATALASTRIITNCILVTNLKNTSISVIAFLSSGYKGNFIEALHIVHARTQTEIKLVSH